jgi:hypothetical protein
MNAENQKKNEDEFIPSKWPARVVTITILFFIVGVGVMYCRAKTITSPNATVSVGQERGVEGDFVSGYFGSITAFCAALLFYAAYLKQSDELRHQIHEFTQIREATVKQEGHLKAQVQNLEEQLKESKLRSDRELLLNMISPISIDLVRADSSRRGSAWYAHLPVFEYSLKFAAGSPELLEIVKTISFVENLWSQTHSPFSAKDKHQLENAFRDYPSIAVFLKQNDKWLRQHDYFQKNLNEK